MSFESYHPGHGCFIYNPKRDREIEEETSKNLHKDLVSGHWPNNHNPIKKRNIEHFSYTINFPSHVDLIRALKETKFEDLIFEFYKNEGIGIIHPKNIELKDFFSDGIPSKYLIGNVSKEKGAWAITLLNNKEDTRNKFNKYVSEVYKNILIKYTHKNILGYNFLKAKE